MELCFEHSVPLPRATVFAFHENPGCIAALHAGWSRLRLLAHDPQLRVGAEIWIEAGDLIPLVLGFRCTVFEPPQRFGEELIHGPFARFGHIHDFREAAGSTVIRDLLEVEMPWQYGGKMATRTVVAPLLTRMFRQRAEAMRRLVANGTIVRLAAQHLARQS